jgi:hypothetical protein
MGTGSFPGGNLPGRGVNHPTPPSAEVQERKERYFYSPFGPSWPVLGITLPLNVLDGPHNDAPVLPPSSYSPWLNLAIQWPALDPSLWHCPELYFGLDSIFMFLLSLPRRMLEYLKTATLYPIIVHIHFSIRIHRSESAMNDSKALRTLRNKFRYLHLPADGFACIAVLISYVDLCYLMTLFQYFLQFN